MEKTKNAIELWAESLKSKPIRPCTEEEASDFLRWSFAELRNAVDEKGLKELLESKQGGMASVFWLRVKHCHTYEVSPTVAAFLGENVIKNFGISTMLANYLQYWAAKRHWAKITMKELSYIFPNGFPEDKSWEDAWGENKIETDNGGFSSDNGLDYPQLMESIKEIVKH